MHSGKAAELIARIKPFLSGPKFVTTVHGTKKNKSAYLAGDAVCGEPSAHARHSSLKHA